MRKTFEDLCQSAKASLLDAETHLSKYSRQLELREERRRLREVGERDRHVLKHDIVSALKAEALACYGSYCGETAVASGPLSHYPDP